MMDRILVGLVVLGVTIFGNLVIRRRLADMLERRDLAIEFHNKLIEYVNSAGRDAELYNWLTLRSTGMQRAMGSHGVMAQFRPPFANYMFRGWPIVLNALPEIQRALADPILFEQGSSYAQILRDAILRYVGDLDQHIEIAESERRNPVRSFRNGVHTVLRGPVFVLYWFGLRSSPSVSGGSLGAFVAGIVALLMFMSALVSLVVGWNDFLQFLAGIFGRITG